LQSVLAKKEKAYWISLRSSTFGAFFPSMSRALKSISQKSKESRSGCSRGDFFGEIPTRDMKNMQENGDWGNRQQKLSKHSSSLAALWKSQPILSSTEYGRRKVRSFPKISKDSSRSSQRKGDKVRETQVMEPLFQAARFENLRESYRRGCRTRLLLRNKMKSAYLYIESYEGLRGDNPESRRRRSWRSVPTSFRAEPRDHTESFPSFKAESRDHSPNMSPVRLPSLQHSTRSMDLRQTRSESGEMLERTDVLGEELRSTADNLQT